MSLVDRLTPRQQRTILDIVTALAIFSVAVALAHLTWHIAGYSGIGPATVPDGKRGATTADLSPALALAPFGKAAVTDGGQPTAIAATLKGVVYAVPSTLSSAVVQIGDQPAVTLRIGDSLANARIVAILRDRIILENGGRTEYLALPDPFAQPSPAPGAPPPASGSPIGQTPPPPVAAPPAPPPAAQAAIDRLGATQTADGYRIGNAAMPGLKAGDVIQSVNGTPLSDSAAANAAFAAAAASGSARVQILRDGKTMTVTVPLR